MTGSCGRPLRSRGLACEPAACSVAQVASWWRLGVDGRSSGLRRRVCLERGEEEEGGGGDDGWRLWPPPQHRGCLSLSLSPSLSRTSDASSPLLSSSLSVPALQILTVCFVCVVCGVH